MYQDAYALIQTLFYFGVVDSITFLKSGKISVKFSDEPKKIHFKELLSVLEMAEQKKAYYDR